eukprot:comp21088_c1_seq1/m.44457 comp21088_c1_seq1/g.44457  ORF comp21088_c1_seq1/g.44457 comp21088_c1_seq1/m.44457 type:complete len:407 (+) comp21088_c1_seq1:1708-2928(+)
MRVDTKSVVVGPSLMCLSCAGSVVGVSWVHSRSAVLEAPGRRESADVLSAALVDEKKMQERTSLGNGGGRGFWACAGCSGEAMLSWTAEPGLTELAHTPALVRVRTPGPIAAVEPEDDVDVGVPPLLLTLVTDPEDEVRVSEPDEPTEPTELGVDAVVLDTANGDEVDVAPVFGVRTVWTDELGGERMRIGTTAGEPALFVSSCCCCTVDEADLDGATVLLAGVRRNPSGVPRPLLLLLLLFWPVSGLFSAPARIGRGRCMLFAAGCWTGVDDLFSERPNTVTRASPSTTPVATARDNASTASRRVPAPGKATSPTVLSIAVLRVSTSATRKSCAGTVEPLPSHELGLSVAAAWEISSDLRNVRLARTRSGVLVSSDSGERVSSDVMSGERVCATGPESMGAGNEL